MRTKQCSGYCKRVLPLDQFRKHKGYGSDDRETRCKACMRVDDKRKAEAKKPQTYPHPLLPAEVAPEYRKMMAYTPEAFKLFYERFSGMKLHAHGFTWVKAALENDLLLLNVPPGHAKTTIMAQWYVIWNLVLNRNAQIILVSKTDSGVKKSSQKIAYELEFNKDLNLAFGRFRPTNSQAPWRVNKGELEIEGKDLSEGSGDLSLQIKGSGQQILGMRATLVVADDVSDQKVARSEVERENQLLWFLGEVMSRLQPTGKAVCIGQRVHMQDLYGLLAKMEDDETGEKVWNQITTPAILDYETKKVLWPEWLPWDKLMKIRARQGLQLFECMYQQNPAAAGDFVQKEWIYGNSPGCLDRERVVGSGWKRDNTYVPITRVISIDPSPRQFCGMVVADMVYLPSQSVFLCNVVDIRRGKFGQREMLANIEDMARLYTPSVCIFEDNSFKNIREDPAWNQITPLFRKTIPHTTTGSNKHNELFGVWSLASDFEAGRIRLPYGDEKSRETSELLIREVLAYTDDGKSSQTDDVLMALWFIKPNFRNLIPLDNLPTRMNRGGVGAAWKGWGRK